VVGQFAHEYLNNHSLQFARRLNKLRSTQNYNRESNKSNHAEKRTSV